MSAIIVSVRKRLKKQANKRFFNGGAKLEWRYGILCRIGENGEPDMKIIDNQLVPIPPKEVPATTGSYRSTYRSASSRLDPRYPW